MGRTAVGGVGDLAGDVEDGLRAGSLDRLRVHRRVINALRGVGLDLRHLDSPVPSAEASPERAGEYSVISKKNLVEDVVKKLVGALAAVVVAMMLMSPPAEARCWWHGSWHCYHPYWHARYWWHPYRYYGWHHHWWHPYRY